MFLKLLFLPVACSILQFRSSQNFCIHIHQRTGDADKQICQLSGKQLIVEPRIQTD